MIRVRSLAHVAATVVAAVLMVPAFAEGGAPANAPSEAPASPARFVTHHEVSVGKARIAFTATAGETWLYTDEGAPVASVFSYAYVKDRAPVSRPVIFITGGGPGAASSHLHVAFGPWALAPGRFGISRGQMPSMVPPYELLENANSLLDVADLVFIDPVGTGYSHAIGAGKAEDFWGLDEDADSIAQFIERWVSRNGRWGSPKFFLGESYGGTRASLVARALDGGPNYPGVHRGMALNGIISLVNGAGVPGIGNDGVGAIWYTALLLPNQAATAWHHQTIDRRGRSLAAFYAEAVQFASTQYVQALQKEADKSLPADERSSVVVRLVELTGLQASSFAGKLSLSADEFSRAALGQRGLTVGVYDSRYTSVSGLSTGDAAADDPALGRMLPIIAGAFHQIEHDKLKAVVDRPYAGILWRRLLDKWSFQHRPVTFGNAFTGSTADELAALMNRNERLYVMLATGYYDLQVSPALASVAAERARMPKERTILKAYEAGHLLYADDAAPAVGADIRQMVRQASQ